ncbi:MAG: serine/threonine protein kinase, partial [Proteobacteria bacterium]
MAVAHNESRIPAGTILVGKYRVQREIGRHAAASVKSPHIVDVYDSGRLEDGRPFIVMEMLEGESLYDRMARDRLISLADTVKIIGDCAKGLIKAHAASIVHRDLKPENIFIIRGEDGAEFCKLLDFGLAKFYAPLVGDEKQNRLTREGAVFGTPAYMSPEQVNGQGNVDHRADLWALGCMAYECLTGRPVWNMDQGVAMTFAAIATEPLPVPSHMNPQIPLTFDLWFKRALERDPNKRFQNAKELSEALHNAVYSANDTDAYPSLPEFQVSNETDPAVPLALDSAGRIVSERNVPTSGVSGGGLASASSPSAHLFVEDSQHAMPTPLGSTRELRDAGRHRGARACCRA